MSFALSPQYECCLVYGTMELLSCRCKWKTPALQTAHEDENDVSAVRLWFYDMRFRGPFAGFADDDGALKEKKSKKESTINVVNSR